MDDIARPPVRLQANSSTSLSLKATQAHIDEFLNDFQSRSSPSKGGDATMTAQLDKLSKALKEQRARGRNKVPVKLTLPLGEAAGVAMRKA